VRWIALAIVLACKRETVARPDPTPPVDAAPPAPLAETTHVALHGRIVDVANGEVLFPLRKVLPRGEVSDERAAYILDDDDIVRAYNLYTGRGLWTANLTTRSDAMVADTHRLYLAEGPNLAIVRKDNGHVTRLPLGSSIEELTVAFGHVIARQGSRLSIIDPAAAKVRATYAATALERSMEDYRTSMMPSRAHFCVGENLPPLLSFRCMDRDGKEAVHSPIALIKPTDPPGTRFTWMATTPNHAIFSTFSFGSFATGTHRAVVVRLSDGAEVARIEEDIVTVVESNGALDGLVSFGPSVRYFGPNGALRWTYKPKWSEPYGKVVALDDRLIVAMHNPIATGVQVFALRRSDGTLLWTGETKLPPIGHSKYRNRVELEPRGDAIILRGHESSVEHVHVYEASTGKLRFHDP
jgi:hypothetical protein